MFENSYNIFRCWHRFRREEIHRISYSETIVEFLNVKKKSINVREVREQEAPPLDKINRF